MQDVAPPIALARRGGTLRLAFLSAVVSLVASFAAAAAPIPLYNTYRAEDGFSNAGISLAVVTYSVGTIAALLVLGRLSNNLGRRLTALASLGLLLLGCLVLLNVHAAGTLLTGRVLVGIGTGLASSSLTSYIVDSAPSRPARSTSAGRSAGSYWRTFLAWSRTSRRAGSDGRGAPSAVRGRQTACRRRVAPTIRYSSMGRTPRVPA
ncbi:MULTISPECIES: MFS transporter [unclassified Streptomyces]|uniref:MFS transporter n=1 Tax=unclassified Streptomyces TaxID=2593676 RepID=UPI000FFE5757|nr:MULTISPECIES: MFS transporter [unclassified Streptomyces]